MGPFRNECHMKITFLGGAQTVTGSKTLLEHAGHQILIDCGLFQGLKEWRLKNWAKLPINPETIEAVFLTHAHIDHSGYIPILVKSGFKGKIFCTKATFELCKILLPDSGHLQEEDAKLANLYHYSKHNPALPLYTQEDAELCLNQFEVVDFGVSYTLFEGLQCTWKRAGHILGASLIEIQTPHQSIVFSGDLGRLRDPIMQAPEHPKNCRTLILESTYGNRKHSPEDPLEGMANCIRHTAERAGTVLIPAFAVGRTQAILYYLDRLKSDKRIPDLAIYLDSPMAIDATQILSQHPGEHRLSAVDCYRICHQVQYIHTPDESRALDLIKTPKIIISASGMMSGGRILHHLKQFGPDKKNSILITGYQAVGTRGYRLLNHETHLKIHGEMIPIKAEVIELTSTSAHADYEEILEWLSHFEILPKKIFINHGELDSALALKQKIESRFSIICIIPKYLESFLLK
jgi:metallo-beta-lactamase family protein